MMTSSCLWFDLQRDYANKTHLVPNSLNPHPFVSSPPPPRFILPAAFLMHPIICMRILPISEPHTREEGRRKIDTRVRALSIVTVLDGTGKMQLSSHDSFPPLGIGSVNCLTPSYCSLALSIGQRGAEESLGGSVESKESLRVPSV